MKKKLLTLVLSAVLCMGMATTAFAATSPSVDNSNTNQSPSVDNDEDTIPVDGTTIINGVAVTLEVKYLGEAPLTEKQWAAIEKLFEGVEDAATYEKMEKNLIESTTGKKVESVKWGKLFDILLPEGQTIPADGIQITLSDSDVKAGMNIVMLHMKADGTWENIPVTVEDGKITGTFTSLSPVYYFEVKEAANTTTNNNTATNNNTTTNNTTTTDNTTTTESSPKTEEVNMNLYITLLAIVAVCGVVYGTRKMKYSK